MNRKTEEMGDREGAPAPPLVLLEVQAQLDKVTPVVAAKVMLTSQVRVEVVVEPV